MRIMFSNIAWMRDYTGNEDGTDVNYIKMRSVWKSFDFILCKASNK